MGSPDARLIHSSSYRGLMLNVSTQVLVSWKMAENGHRHVKLQLFFSALDYFKRELQLQIVSNTSVSSPLHLARRPFLTGG